MSDNPFASSSDEGMPAPAPQNYAQPVKPPGAITPIAVICLILGILGLIGVCFMGDGFAMQGFAERMMAEAPDSPDMEIQRINLEAQKSVMLPNIVLGLINLVVATMLVIGSIGCLRRKEGGRNMLRTGLMAAIAYSFFKLVIGFYSQFVTQGALTEAIANYDGPADKQQLETILNMTKYIGIGGAIVTALFTLALAGFYFWSHGYLNREEVINYFASAPDAKS